MKRGNRLSPVVCSFIRLVRRMHTHASASVLDKRINKWADVVLHAVFRRCAHIHFGGFMDSRHRYTAHPDQTRHDVSTMPCSIISSVPFLSFHLHILCYSIFSLRHISDRRTFVLFIAFAIMFILYFPHLFFN